MSGSFYPKLAATNIRKNARNYVPYILTCIFTVAMYYIMRSLSLNNGIENVFGGGTVAYTLKFGSGVIAIFSVIFLFYTNSFLTKKRKKEFGLFNILGMEKKHIAKIMAYESMYTALLGIGGGIGFGILLDKLMFVAVIRIVKSEIPLGFYVSDKAIVSTLMLFGVLFLLIFLNSLRLIHLAKPIELLQGGSVGEKEPKAKWLFALFGIACLITGYYIAVTVKNPISALSLFFLAVILVIVGTYCLFTAGSIAFLKILKKNKRYYYKTNHFISVSGMMYRMKQNAVGLANICILSTMVLVMISSTSSLMIGVEDIINDRYPYQLEFSAYTSDTDTIEDIVDMVNETSDEEDIAVTKQTVYTSLQFSAVYKGGNEFEFPEKQDLSLLDYVHNLCFITAEDYSNYIGRNVTLNDEEVIFYSNSKPFKEDSVKIFGKEYIIKERTDNYISDEFMDSELIPTFGIVVNDIDAINEIRAEQDKVYGENTSVILSHCKINTNGSAEEQKSLYDKVWDKLTEYTKVNDISYTTTCRENQRENIYGLYGGLFFLGIFMGLLFTIATVLIIYYKQISEGCDDKNRFEIMQKVGMSEQEVKSSIRSQVLMVFFMPLIMAGIHLSFAFPIVKKILIMLQLSNVNLFIACNIGVFLIFALIYISVYLMTSRVYYKIIKR